MSGFLRTAVSIILAHSALYPHIVGAQWANVQNTGIYPQHHQYPVPNFPGFPPYPLGLCPCGYYGNYAPAFPYQNWGRSSQGYQTRVNLGLTPFGSSRIEGDQVLQATAGRKASAQIGRTFADRSALGSATSLKATETSISRSPTKPPSCPEGQVFENGACINDYD